MVLVPESNILPPMPSISNELNQEERMDHDQPRRGRPRKDPESLVINKLWRAVNIAIRLHFAGRVDTAGRLLDAFRKPVEQANLVSLIDYSLTKGRAKVGETEFINALHAADVPADWLVNEDTLSKYRHLKSTRTPLEKSFPTPIPPPPPLVRHEPSTPSDDVAEIEAPTIARETTPPPPELDYYGPPSKEIPAKKIISSGGPIRVDNKERPNPYSRKPWIRRDGLI